MTKAEPAGRCHRGGTHDCFRRRRRSETDGRRQRQRSTHLSQGHLSHGRQSTTPWRRERSAASSPSSPDRTVQIRLRHPALVIIDHNSASVPASLPLTAAQGSSETVHCKLSSFVIDEKDVRPRWPKRYTALPAISRQVGQCETDTILTHGTFSAPPAGPLGWSAPLAWPLRQSPLYPRRDPWGIANKMPTDRWEWDRPPSLYNILLNPFSSPRGDASLPNRQTDRHQTQYPPLSRDR